MYIYEELEKEIHTKREENIFRKYARIHWENFHFVIPFNFEIQREQKFSYWLVSNEKRHEIILKIKLIYENMKEEAENLALCEFFLKHWILYGEKTFIVTFANFALFAVS